MKRWLIFFLILLFPLMVSGIGVSPPSTLLSWEPGFQGNYTHSVINTAGRPIIATVTLKGVLAPYVTYYDKEVEMTGSSGQFMYSIRMPEESELVGYQYAEFHITEEDPKTGGTGAKTAVVTKLRIEFPYPGIYATYYLNCPSVNEGDDIICTSSLRNLGKETIKDSFITFSLREMDGTVLSTEREDGITFAPGEDMDFRQVMSTEGMPPGPYQVLGEYHYEKKIMREVNLTIGTFDIDILEHSETIEKLPIAKFTVKVKSKWKGTISNVFGSLYVNGKEHKSPTISLSDFQEGILEFYVSAEDLIMGNGKSSVIVKFQGKEKEKDLAYTLVEPKEPEIEEPKEEPKKRQLAIPINMTTMLIILVIILVAINAYILLRKKDHKKK